MYTLMSRAPVGFEYCFPVLTDGKITSGIPNPDQKVIKSAQKELLNNVGLSIKIKGLTIVVTYCD
jgi:hypothetical protein